VQWLILKKINGVKINHRIKKKTVHKHQKGLGAKIFPSRMLRTTILISYIVENGSKEPAKLFSGCFMWIR
jgi:hypothetical protein